MAAKGTNFVGDFLIATPALRDSSFCQAVVYVCEHNQQGTLGVVINHPSGMTLADVLSQIELPAGDPRVAQRVVYDGGPVQPQHCLILHRPHGVWSSSLAVDSSVALTASSDLLEAIAGGAGPEQFLLCLGYAGWAAGQLQAEIASNAWLTVPADPDILFEVPDRQRWQAAAQLLGVDMARFSGEVGHG